MLVLLESRRKRLCHGTESRANEIKQWCSFVAERSAGTPRAARELFCPAN